MTTVTHRLRSTLLAFALVSLVVVLAACNRNGVDATASAQHPGAGRSITPEPTTPTTSATTSESPAAGRSSPARTLSGGRCTAAQLRLSVIPGPNAAGHIGLILRFTNISTKPCTMFGYPGVSFVTGHGNQINDPAQRSAASGNPSVVTLAPDGKADASLLLVNIANYAGNNLCQPTLAAAVRVYPPDDTTAILASSPQQICDVKGTGVPQIYPVQTGAGGP